MEIKVSKMNSEVGYYSYYKSLNFTCEDLESLFGEPEIIKWKSGHSLMNWFIKFSNNFAVLYLSTRNEKECSVAYLSGLSPGVKREINKILEHELESRRFSIWFNNFSKEE